MNLEVLSNMIFRHPKRNHGASKADIKDILLLIAEMEAEHKITEGYAGGPMWYLTILTSIRIRKLNGGKPLASRGPGKTIEALRTRIEELEKALGKGKLK